MSPAARLNGRPTKAIGHNGGRTLALGFELGAWRHSGDPDRSGRWWLSCQTKDGSTARLPVLAPRVQSRRCNCLVAVGGITDIGTRWSPEGSVARDPLRKVGRCFPCPSCFAEIDQRAADGSREALAWMLSSLRTTSGVLARAMPHSVAIPNPLTYLPAASIRCLAPSTPSAACTSPR
jgi:hypothetical protein